MSVSALPPRLCVVYRVQGDVRRYWLGAQLRSWRTGDRGRQHAARFPDALAARAALDSCRSGRRWLSQVGYEWLPLVYVAPALSEQLQVIAEGGRPR